MRELTSNDLILVGVRHAAILWCHWRCLSRPETVSRYSTQVGVEVSVGAACCASLAAPPSSAAALTPRKQLRCDIVRPATRVFLSQPAPKSGGVPEPRGATLSTGGYQHASSQGMGRGHSRRGRSSLRAAQTTGVA